MRADQVMKRTSTSVSQTVTVQAVAVLMVDDSGMLPICDDEGRAVGVVTKRDILARIATDGGCVTAPVSSIMSTDVVTCTLEEPLASVEKRMRDQRTARAVVVDERDRPAGVISASDLPQGE